MARELERYGVTVNSISPRALTRLSAEANGVTSEAAEAVEATHRRSPHNVAPLVAYLASDEASDISGQVFLDIGDTIELWQGWRSVAESRSDDLWTVDSAGSAVRAVLEGQRSTPGPLPWQESEVVG